MHPLSFYAFAPGILFGLSLSNPPLYEGLPESLPDDPSYVSFSPVSDSRHRTPLGTRFVINGEEVFWADAGKIAEIFSEEHLALLPSGQSISVSRDRKGREIWDYPVGTRLLHRIRLRTEPPTEFEARIIEKRADLNWAYGLYAWENGFVLKKYKGFEPVSFEVKLAGGKGVKVSMERINLNSCQQCHFSFTLDRHQYAGSDSAGPCGFTPSNSGLKTDWASRYAEKHGYAPFK